MNEFYIKVGQRIWQLRYELSISREALSEIADISTKFLYDVENGNKGISAYNLYKLANALHVSCDYLLTGQNSINNNDPSNKNIEFIENLLDELEPDKLPAVKRILNELIYLTK